MRDARIRSGVWRKDAEVYVVADTPVATGSTRKTMAVLEVHPSGVPFRIGWRTDQSGAANFYSENVRTLGDRFAMEVADNGVWFVVRAADGRTGLTIDLVNLTTTSDLRYADTPRY